MTRARKLETLEIVGEDGKKQWLLFNLTPLEKEILHRYQELPAEHQATVNAVFAGLGTKILTTAQAEEFGRAAEPLKAARAWALSTTPAQRARMERYWARTAKA